MEPQWHPKLARGSIWNCHKVRCGLRSVLATCLVPYDVAYLGLGACEMLLFHCMIRPIVEDELSNIKERSLGANIYTSTRALSTDTRETLLEGQGMIMTVYLVSLSIAFMFPLPSRAWQLSDVKICGPSATRRHQLMRKKELVHRMLELMSCLQV